MGFNSGFKGLMKALQYVSYNSSEERCSFFELLYLSRGLHKAHFYADEVWWKAFASTHWTAWVEMIETPI